jgi:hypothetical protein
MIERTRRTPRRKAGNKSIKFMDLSSKAGSKSVTVTDLSSWISHTQARRDTGANAPPSWKKSNQNKASKPDAGAKAPPALSLAAWIEATIRLPDVVRGIFPHVGTGPSWALKSAVAAARNFAQNKTGCAGRMRRG